MAEAASSKWCASAQCFVSTNTLARFAALPIQSSKLNCASGLPLAARAVQQLSQVLTDSHWRMWMHTQSHNAWDIKTQSKVYECANMTA